MSKINCDPTGELEKLKSLGINDGNTYWWYNIRCEACRTTESVAGPKRENTSFHEFADLLRRSPVYNSHFRYCNNCKKMTRTILIAYEGE